MRFDDLVNLFLDLGNLLLGVLNHLVAVLNLGLQVSRELGLLSGLKIVLE